MLCRFSNVSCGRIAKPFNLINKASGIQSGNSDKRNSERN